MKASSDPRHQKRLTLVQKLFAESYHPSLDAADKRAIDIRNHIPEIDKLIAESAPEYPVDKIAKVDVAVLRLCIYELLFEKKEPPKVVIDEAVELAKELGGDGSPGFVNGVMGALLKKTTE